ncbi:hypothetical protein, partial [Microbacterium sp. S16(2024)]|uniref:hypothetical protein n=1 Tax=Microbacterium sp. S16(2024) TaxID=3368601 RepID=UPI00373EFDA4
MAPAATASASTLLLKFDKTGYTGSGCSTVTGASVKATDATSGAGVAGVAVVVTLPNGYTFDGGTTTYSGTTAASGVLALPGIHLPASGNSQTITALATTGETTSSTLSVTSTAYNTAAPNGSTAAPAAKAYTLGTLPAGTTMLNAYWALSP